MAGPGKLVAQTSSGNKFAQFSKDHMDGKYRQLTAVPETNQQFVFMSCPAPSSVYPKASDSGDRISDFGQVRSVKHPDMCMTIKGTVNKLESSPSEKDHLSLQLCASSVNDKNFEKQWFQVHQRKPHGQLELYHWGRKTDMSRAAVAVGNDGLVSLFSDNQGHNQRLVLQ